MTRTPMERSINNGLFWYKDEATYLRFREIITDPEQIVSPYAKWVEDAEKQIKIIAQRGIILVKINADPDEFIAWCELNSCRPDSRARRQFAITKVSEILGQG